MSKVRRIIGCSLIFVGIMTLLLTSGYGEVEMAKVHESPIRIIWIFSVLDMFVGLILLHPYQFFKHLSAIICVIGVVLYKVFRFRKCKMLYLEYRILGSFSKFYKTQLLAWDLIHESE